VTPAQLASVREGYGKYGFKATQFEALNPVQARDAERLKRLLDSGMLAIPVGYQIQARIRIRVGDFLALDPAMPEASRWKRTVQFRPFAPQLGSSIDLTPE
jgi:hypothetical protein